MSTKIDWCDEVWNPTTGCTKGCSYCYAKAFAERMAKNPNAKIAHKYRNGFTPTCHSESLTLPLKWKQPRRIFVDSMGDLFDPEIPFEFIHSVLATVALSCKQHTFMVLTKQPGRMMEYFKTLYDVPRSCEPIPNLWLGVSVTNPAEAAAFLPYLFNTPAAKRFVSLEPLQRGVDLCGYLGNGRLDWVICGLMSGKFREIKSCSYEDVADLRDQCGVAGVPFYFKGWGSFRPGAQLDGREYREFPA